MVRTLQATDDFEVTWDDPAAADQRWAYDREHNHGALTRFELEASAVASKRFLDSPSNTLFTAR